MAVRKRTSSRSSSTSGVHEVELAIRKAQTRIAKEGKTDEMEALLDDIEHKLNTLKGAGINPVEIKRLKSSLDVIK